MKAKSNYFSDLSVAVSSVYTGLRLTFLHLLAARKGSTSSTISESNYFAKQEGIATIQYPHEAIPVPDIGRYQLHNEIDDCIVCDKCAKICPVNCIDIVPVKSPEEIGKTSDGTSKRIYAAKFDIDMAKCCFCGLCTTVCPTECLTMTKKYDFSVLDVREHNFVFGTMTAPEIEEKKAIWEEYQRSKATVTPASIEENKEQTPAQTPSGTKPVFRPKVMVKPAAPSSEAKEEKSEQKTESPPPAAAPRPVFRPKIKPTGPSASPPLES